jgi:hypothetical protein
MGRDTTCQENATRSEHQHPIEAIIQPPAGQPTMMPIELPKKTDLNVLPRLPDHLHLGQDDLLMPPLTTEVARMRPEELGDKSLTLTNPHPQLGNVTRIPEPTALSVQNRLTIESPTKRAGLDPLINVVKIRTAEQPTK